MRDDVLWKAIEMLQIASVIKHRSLLLARMYPPAPADPLNPSYEALGLVSVYDDLYASIVKARIGQLAVDQNLIVSAFEVLKNVVL